MISRRNSALALASIALTAIFSVAPAHAQDAPKVKLATERAIRTSARKLFLRKGLAGTNTSEIAGAAKVAWSGAAIAFFDKVGTNQDACKLATVNLVYTAA